MKKNFVAFTVFLPLCLIASSKMHAGLFDWFRSRKEAAPITNPTETAKPLFSLPSIDPQEADFKKVLAIHQQGETVPEHYKHIFEKKEQKALDEIRKTFELSEHDQDWRTYTDSIKALRTLSDHTPVNKIKFDADIPEHGRKIVRQLAREASPKNSVRQVKLASIPSSSPASATAATHAIEGLGNEITFYRPYFSQNPESWDHPLARHAIRHELEHAAEHDPAATVFLWGILHDQPRVCSKVNDSVTTLKKSQEKRADLYPLSQDASAAADVLLSVCPLLHNKELNEKTDGVHLAPSRLCEDAAKFVRLHIAERLANAFDDFMAFQEDRAVLYPASQNLHAAVCATRFECRGEYCQSGKICEQAAKFVRLRTAERLAMEQQCPQPADEKTARLCQHYAEHRKKFKPVGT